MGTLFKIAWRNVCRHGKRTILTVITMTFGLGFYIMVDSMLKGMDRTGLETIVNLSDSSVRISTKEYEAERRSSPLNYGIADPAALEASLRRDARVTAVATRTRFIGQLSNGRDGIPVMAVAVEPERDSQVFTLAQYTDGVWFTGKTEGKPIVIGAGLAEDLGFILGDWVTLSARTRYETQNADDFQVVGLISCSDSSINSSGVYINLADAEDFLELEGLRTEMVVRMVPRINLKDAMADSDAVAKAVVAADPGLEAKSFGEVGRAFLEIAKMKSKGTGVIIIIILLIAGVGIANTVLMSVFSRIREIGVLRAFGLKPKDISRLFLFEGAIIGGIGSVGGVIFGILMDAYLIFYGFPMSVFLGDIDLGLPIGDTLYGEWNPDQMVFAVIFGIVIALISSRSPAKKAAGLEVTNALRFV